MKIAYFVNQYPKVSHTFIRREILALERRGFTVQRYALRGWAEVCPDPADSHEMARTRHVLRNGLAGLVLPGLATLVSSPLRLARALRLALRMSIRTDHRHLHHVAYLAEACRLVRWMRSCGCRHLHAHFGTNSAEVAMYARCLGGPPYSFTVHGPEEFESPLGLGEKVGRAAFVAAISSYCRSQLYLRCDPAQWPKVHVVHCGVDADFRQAAEEVVPRPRRLVCVGRLCEAKGQVLLVEAIAALRGKGVGVELVLAGDGPMRAAVEQAIVRHGLGENVRITGWIGGDQVRREMLAARAMVLPSFAEGLPVVIMEAMMLHKPVISTYVAGIPELVRSGENGWLVPAGSLADLVDAIEDCLSRSDEEIGRMGDAGFARVSARHSVDTEAAKLAELFVLDQA